MAPSFTSFAILFTWMGYLLVMITIILSNKRVQINLSLSLSVEWTSVSNMTSNNSFTEVKKPKKTQTNIAVCFVA